MAWYSARRYLVVSFAWIFACGSAEFVNAVGYYNMPGDFCQWTGHGFGGGYHAPFVLGPVRFDRAVFPNVTRISQALNPYGCAPVCGSDGSGYDRGIAEPTMMPMAPTGPPISPVR